LSYYFCIFYKNTKKFKGPTYIQTTNEMLRSIIGHFLFEFASFFFIKVLIIIIIQIIKKKRVAFQFLTLFDDKTKRKHRLRIS